jgi:hypothetical protein
LSRSPSPVLPTKTKRELQNRSISSPYLNTSAGKSTSLKSRSNLSQGIQQLNGTIQYSKLPAHSIAYHHHNGSPTFSLEGAVAKPSRPNHAPARFSRRAVHWALFISASGSNVQEKSWRRVRRGCRGVVVGVSGVVRGV